MSLYVGSIFADDSAEQVKWFNLQVAFLRATTPNFRHVAVISTGRNNQEFFGWDEVLEPPDLTLAGSEAHVQGLQILLDHFKSVGKEGDHFLFLDSDAFPIRKNWLPLLVNKMAGVKQRNLDWTIPPKANTIQYEIAVALRSENLEHRLHASILFAGWEGLNRLDFECGLSGLDLMGQAEMDVFLPTYQLGRRYKAFPLIRSNAHNVHPVACGVYFDMFYHHCCGSGRTFALRCMDYYDSVIYPKQDVSSFSTQLFADPTGFVSRLAGWNQQKYAVVENLNG